MDDTVSGWLAARLSTPLLLLAMTCLALPLVLLPAGQASGPALAVSGAHPEAAIAVVLLVAALATSLTRMRHRVSLLVLGAGFATAALLLLRISIGTAAEDGAGQVLGSVGGSTATFGILGDAVQQALSPRWTAAYWVALLAPAAVFLLNSWALLRQPEPAAPGVPPPAAAPLS